MSTSSDLQRWITDTLGAPGALSVPVPSVHRRTKDLGSEIEAAAANHGLCLYVMPPLPRQVDSFADFVFVERCECRVRIVEQPAKNASSVDAWALANEVMTALHWRQPAGLLSHPLYLAARPVEWEQMKDARIVDVLFNAVFGLQPRREVAAQNVAGADVVQAPDLQAAAARVLRASGQLSAAVPVLERRRKSMESDIEAAAAERAALGIEVLPARPRRAMQGADFVFIEESELRVRVVEVPPLNPHDVDAYDLAEEVMTALHWCDFGGALPQPLRLAPAPIEEVEEGASKRVLEVIFHATHQINAEAAS